MKKIQAEEWMERTGGWLPWASSGASDGSPSRCYATVLHCIAYGRSQPVTSYTELMEKVLLKAGYPNLRNKPVLAKPPFEEKMLTCSAS